MIKRLDGFIHRDLLDCSARADVRIASNRNKTRHPAYARHNVCLQPAVVLNPTGELIEARAFAKAEEAVEVVLAAEVAGEAGFVARGVERGLFSEGGRLHFDEALLPGRLPGADVVACSVAALL